jgi:hypothetical protein
MESNFDIHQWQAKHLKKLTLNEETASASIALQVQRHLQAAMDVIEGYKETNQIPSNESDFDDVEATLEELLITLGHIGEKQT